MKILLGGEEVTAISELADKTLEFEVEVDVKGGAAQTVTWAVESDSGTTESAIDADGMLSIHADEEPGTVLTVTATSTVDPTKDATVAVTVLDPSAPQVTRITVTAAGGASTVTQGQGLQFAVVVDVVNSAAKTVAWTISGQTKSATTITTTGLLNVAADEPADTEITVTATSAVQGFGHIKDSVTVTVTAAGGPPDSDDPLLIYSNGVFYNDFDFAPGGDGFAGEGWEVAVTHSTAGGGHGGNTTSMTVAPGWGQWGWGLGVNKYSAPGTTGTVDFTQIDAVSLWVKATGAMTGTFGFMDDAGQNNDALSVEYAGESGTGTTFGTEWQRIVIPVPNPANAQARSQVLKLWIGNGVTETLYIDDIRLIKAENKTVELVLAETGTASPNATLAAAAVVGSIRIKYTLDGIVASLFHNGGTHKEGWYAAPTYTVSGDGATLSGNNLTTGATGETFTISATAMGVTSNTKTVTIVYQSNPVIDGFDYYQAEAGLAAVNAYGFAISGGNWWYGLILNHEGRHAMQLGGDNANPQYIQRSNASGYDYYNNIRPLVASNPKLRVRAFTRSAEGSSQLTFELHTGPHTTVDTGFTAWAAPAFTSNRTIPTGNQYNDHDSGWVEYDIPLTDFVNNGASITDGSGDIVITGWRLSAPSGINLWVSTIELIP